MKVLLNDWGMEDCKGSEISLPREIDDLQIRDDLMLPKDVSLSRLLQEFTLWPKIGWTYVLLLPL